MSKVAEDLRGSSRTRATSWGLSGEELRTVLSLLFLLMTRTKMTELTSEISRLTREVEAASEEQGTCVLGHRKQSCINSKHS